MSLELLREFVRAVILLEAAVPVASAVQQGLAMFTQPSGQGTRFVLYDPKHYAALAEQSKESYVDYDTKGIYAYFQLAPGPATSCAGAAEVSVASARKGYGPMMYDICMSFSPAPIMADRSSVTPAAASVWKYYGTRTDVEKIQLDADSCREFEDRPELNFAYRPKQKVDFSGLLRNHQAFAQQMQALGREGQEMLAELPRLGLGFFDELT